MPKKQKTRKQKLQADQRKKLSVSTPAVTKAVKSRKQISVPSSEEKTPRDSYTLPTTSVQAHPAESATVPRQTTTIITKGYNYLRTDLRKTTVVTSTIVLALLLIYFFL